ncbi:Fic family protein [Candidatus Woesearchaeota archaeon]|nr:Fic family protein [Candidatus Woesearchaeota archaeon]
MFIEKRKVGKSTKYYLVYSYREKGRVKKIRHYLGLNLTKEELLKVKDEAEQQIKKELDELRTEIFNFALTKNQLAKLNSYDAQIKVHHLQGFNWKKFTEQFTYSTNAIEGSSVQLDQVPEILEKKKAKDSEELETKGVAKAVDFIKSTKEELSLELIKKLHKLCFEGSKHFAGQFRNCEVVIRNGRGELIHAGVPVSKLDEALKELIEWHKKNKKKFKPLILAAIIHNQFEHIHPFQDGNGRVGRLLLNFILLKSKHPPVNISLEDRAEYYNTLQEYSKNQNLRPTVIFLIKQYKKTLKQVTTKKRK